jgi:hypothetical protein
LRGQKARGEDPTNVSLKSTPLIARAKTTPRSAVGAQNRNCIGAPEKATWWTDREAVRAKFEKIRARDPELASKMLMAARNGQGLSDSDMEGMLEDLAKLERLDGEDDEK